MCIETIKINTNQVALILTQHELHPEVQEYLNYILSQPVGKETEHNLAVVTLTKKINNENVTIATNISKTFFEKHLKFYMI